MHYSLLCLGPFTMYLKIFLNPLFMAAYMGRSFCNLFNQPPTNGYLYFQSFDVIKKKSTPLDIRLRCRVNATKI